MAHRMVFHNQSHGLKAEIKRNIDELSGNSGVRHINVWQNDFKYLLKYNNLTYKVLKFGAVIHIEHRAAPILCQPYEFKMNKEPAKIIPHYTVDFGLFKAEFVSDGNKEKRNVAMRLKSNLSPKQKADRRKKKRMGG